MCRFFSLLQSSLNSTIEHIFINRSCLHPFGFSFKTQQLAVTEPLTQENFNLPNLTMPSVPSFLIHNFQ